MGRIIDFIKGNEYTDDEEVGGYETEEFDAVEDNDRNGFGTFAFQHSLAVGNIIYEVEKPYFKEHSY